MLNENNEMQKLQINQETNDTDIIKIIAKEAKSDDLKEFIIGDTKDLSKNENKMRTEKKAIDKIQK